MVQSFVSTQPVLKPLLSEVFPNRRAGECVNGDVVERWRETNKSPWPERANGLQGA